MIQKRRQLTLFISPSQNEKIEQIRSQYNPEQFKIIAAHVTLCREEEIDSLDEVVANLNNRELKSITLNFGDAVRFSEGNGVLLPCENSEESFQNLRKEILSGIIENPKKHNAHITLMHPRNSSCTNEIFDNIKQFGLPKIIQFDQISLIEQEIDKEWKILKQFPLK